MPACCKDRLGGNIGALLGGVKVFARAGDKIDEVVDPIAERVLGETADELETPELTGAGYTQAAPALEAVMFDIGRIEGELFIDSLEELEP